MDGMRDFVFCSNDLYIQNNYESRGAEIEAIPITDPDINAKNLEIKILYKKESWYLLHKKFDYDYSNGVFMKLYPEEEYPL